MPCQALLVHDSLTLDTGRCRRTFGWNGGLLVPRTLEEPTCGLRLELGGQAPRCEFPGIEPKAADGHLQVEEVAETAAAPAHVRATVTCSLGALHLRQVFRLYPDCPAIAGDLFLRRTGPLPSWRQSSAHEGDLRNIESAAAAAEGVLLDTVTERLGLPGPHWRVSAVRFTDITDRNNNLVSRESILPYRHEKRLVGNLLLARRTLEAGGVFVIKEAPCAGVQLAWPGGDFAVKIGEVRVLGVGITPEDLPEGEWVRGYGAVTGLYDGTERSALLALHDYQRRLRLLRPGRDHMIMMNTWGDRSQDSRVRHDFALAELDAGARLGITHFQLDDGWQKGRSSNSAGQGGSLNRIWDHPDYWTPHPERFPQGLRAIVDHGRDLGIEVCLWFNPSADDSYAHWQDDARTLISLHRDCGIRTFKIDGVQIRDKRAEVNLRRLFDTVAAALGGQAVFNLDVTAGRRYGYHTFTEYGNLFLENRYTDWSNYYPHWTLRNLWMLARFIPAQRLQIEFLNRWRNPAKYPADDPLAPCRVPFDYCFAIALMAQPLAWFEGTGLPAEAFAVAPLLRLWRQHAEAIHAGTILPIGEEPSGTGWTGFQSCGPRDTGYLLVLREYNDRPQAGLQTWLEPGSTVELQPLAGPLATRTAVVDAAGGLEFALPQAFSFGLCRYVCR